MVLRESNILLESGTNEIEVIVFTIESATYGINVLKVREVINATTITPILSSHQNVEGMIQIREEVLPVINLAQVLGFSNSVDPLTDKFLICEFNKIKIAFRVHQVTRIHRMLWKQIEKPTELSIEEKEYATGVIHLENSKPILLDFEKVIIEISPNSGVNQEGLEDIRERDRTEKKVVIAEDSAMLRGILEQTLRKLGYENLTLFEDGQEAWDYLELVAQEASEDIHEHVDLIITDLEMPQMDGHHLIKKIKENHRLNILPVIIYSSLVSEDLEHKGKEVGADAQVNKKDMVRLVEEMDELLF